MVPRFALEEGVSCVYMADIRFIAIHHAGGIASDPYASSLALTPAKVSTAHKARWDFPSEYMKDPAGKPWYGGYNCIYDPKDRSFTQFRAIGEETAAQYGYNFNTFSVCIIGNYSKRPLGAPAGTVDPMTETIKDDIAKFLHDLMEGNRRGLVVAPGTGLDFDISRVHPHRFYQQTECYGTGLDDNLFRDLLVAYNTAPLPQPPGMDAETPSQLIPRAAIEKILMQLYIALSDLLRLLQAKDAPVGGGRSCDSVIS